MKFNKKDRKILQRAKTTVDYTHFFFLERPVDKSSESRNQEKYSKIIKQKSMAKKREKKFGQLRKFFSVWIVCMRKRNDIMTFCGQVRSSHLLMFGCRSNILFKIFGKML